MNPQQRGYELEKLLNSLFLLEGFVVDKPFVRQNQSKSQIDGAFKFESNYFILECKWMKSLPSTEVTVFQAKVNASGANTSGLFLSVEGFPSTATGPGVLHEQRRNVMLMDGDELEHCLQGKLTIRAAIEQKLHALNVKGEPHFRICPKLATVGKKKSKQIVKKTKQKKTKDNTQLDVP